MNMKLMIKNTFSILAIMSSALTIASGQTNDPLPSTADVVAKMMQLDAKRRSEMSGYTATRRYVAVNKKRQAEMLVGVACDINGTKQFSIVSEEGSNSIRKHVLHKILNEEAEASRAGTRNSTRLTPENYDFQLVGKEILETGPAYVLQVLPKSASKYLVDGKIWVDASDYSIVRIEGQPARDPSFWVRSVHFVHTYQKVGDFWLASSTHTISDIRLFGSAELTIENYGYTLNPPKDRATETFSVARVVQ